MKIARLECEQFLGVPNGAYSFLAANRLVPNELTVVAGMRGSGKTRLLDAIVALKELVGAYRAPPPLSDLLAVGARMGKLQGTFLLSDEEKDVAQLASNELTVEVGFGEAVPEMSKVSVADRPRELRCQLSEDRCQRVWEVHLISAVVTRRASQRRQSWIGGRGRGVIA